MMLHSPFDGSLMIPDTPHSLRDRAGVRWPVVDGIPYLRVGREALVEDVLRRLDLSDTTGALVELLRDADDWWDGPPPARAELVDLVEARERITLRDAMTALGYGRVGDYFAHRWSDPTFVSGLALIEAHWHKPALAFELACGIGHYLRELQARGVSCLVGADVVYSKVWLARTFVVGPEASFLCFDAAAPWPLPENRFDLVLCEDAFYFLSPKSTIATRLRRACADGGMLLVGHIHNRETANHSAGAGMTAAELDELFPGALAYDDTELARSAVERRPPEPRATAALRSADAFAIAEGPPGALPMDGWAVSGASGMRRNPLYRRTPDGWSITWPSERYAAEYAALATYPPHDPGREVDEDSVRRRIHVDLPERW